MLQLADAAAAGGDSAATIALYGIVGSALVALITGGLGVLAVRVGRSAVATPPAGTPSPELTRLLVDVYEDVDTLHKQLDAALEREHLWRGRAERLGWTDPA